MKRNKIALYSASAFSIALALANPVHAQETARPEQANQFSGEIVVTAQRRSESIQNVPLTVQAISGETLSEKGVEQVQDLQRLTPNVTIASPLGAGSAPAINIRGIGLNDFNTNNPGPNGVYVDEFYVSSPNAQGMSFFDIERVEVLKGPQGTLYGRNSNGGALNISTVKPSDTLKMDASASYSSFDTVNLEAGIGGPITGTLSGRLSGMYNYSEGFMYNHLYNRHENGTNMGAGRGQLLWKPSSDFSALLKVQYVRNVTRAPMYKFYGTLDPVTFDTCSVSATFANECVDIYGYQGRKGFYEGDWDNGDAKLRATDFNTTLRMEHEFPNGMNLVSVTGYNYNKRFHPEQTDAGPFQILRINFGAKSREFTQEVRLSQDVGKFKWVLGGYYIHEKIIQDQPLFLLLDGDDIYGPGFFDGVALIEETNNVQKTDGQAVFGQADYELTDAFSVTVGARYTWENKNFFQNSSTTIQQGGTGNFADPVVTNFGGSISEENFSWRLGANYKFDPDLMLYASAATGFKAGGFNGGFLSTDPDQRLLQLQPFKPEKVTSYELGFKSRLFDRRVTFNLAAFYSDYRDQQVSVLVEAEPFDFFALSNAQKSRTYGIDAELSIRPIDDLTLSGSLGYLNSKITEFHPDIAPNVDYSGNRLSMAPKITATLGAAYRKDIGFTTLGLQWDSSYRSLVYFDPSNNPRNIQDSYWLHNARVSFGFEDDRIEVAGFVRNLTKTKYAIWNAELADFGLVAGTQGMPRVFGVEVKFRR